MYKCSYLLNYLRMCAGRHDFVVSWKDVKRSRDHNFSHMYAIFR